MALCLRNVTFCFAPHNKFIDCCQSSEADCRERLGSYFTQQMNRVTSFIAWKAEQRFPLCLLMQVARVGLKGGWMVDVRWGVEVGKWILSGGIMSDSKLSIVLYDF